MQSDKVRLFSDEKCKKEMASGFHKKPRRSY